MRLAILLCLLPLAGCGTKEELGMKVDIHVNSGAVAPPTEGLLEQAAGEFTLAVAGNQQDEALPLLLAALPESAPAGRMVFTDLVITNRRMDHPPRGSVIIEAAVHWQPAGDDAASATITLKTYSVSLEYPETEIPWLREQASKGLWRRLFKAL